ncbi:hypothetical protein APR04_003790 [Promicromonospora umidemergens]|uniref:Uncharacterized protein n=1 Tax=Promicromonospora umidemergens TaxID=629679 RepID=A0ABP8XH47_9MICO|nr:hypothetical protein [Promicromonospora umidemergens]MCP2284867.1 hypothetical protein [Promicromonospora umidemergens]
MVNELSPTAMGALVAATVPSPIAQAIFGPALAYEKDLAERAARGEEVDLMEPAVGECNRCHRQTWDEVNIGTEDRMTQPDGGPCGGRFEPTH